MTRPNNRERTDTIMLLLERDGNICQGCKYVFKDIRNIRVDHIDDDEDHNCLENKQLLCTECNEPHNKELLFGSCRTPSQRLCVCDRVRRGVRMLYSKEEVDQMCADYPEVADKIRELALLNLPFDPELALSQKILEDIANGRETNVDPAAVARRKAKKEQAEKEAETLQDQKDDAALTPPMRKNKKTEGPFHKWLTESIASGMKFDFKAWKDAGANEFKCSPATIEKYLDKRTNPINGDLIPIADGKTVYLGFRK